MAMCKRRSMFMLGLGMGAAAGVLLAPKSGKEIRRELFGSSASDIMEEPGTESMAPGPQSESAEDLKERIEQTRTRLKAEIEAQPEG